ncbi:MAG: MFS transporter [Pedobacter sp.]|nr:MAG: MFS transporter [Pedobacter sp.]
MKRILPVIVIAQFFCTSLWFAGNAVVAELALRFGLKPAYLLYLSSALLCGFIMGTLFFALFSISDRFSSTKVFLISALIAGTLNFLVSVESITIEGVFLCRFFTGFFLAGIYPVGMKIAADNFKKDLGRSLGFLVGALVLGSAFPHLVKSMLSGLPWKYVLYTTSSLCIIGGLGLYLLVPDAGIKGKGKFNAGLLWRSFKNKHFFAAAIGYFGHMWELYAFWVFVPVLLSFYEVKHPGAAINVSLWSFVIIGSGSVACVLSGIVSRSAGTARTAIIALSLSCACCILSPIFIIWASAPVFIAFLVFWGVTVIADSPLFSSLVAQNAEPEVKGSSITIVTCIGFAITIITIQGIGAILNNENATYIYMLLAIGPCIGLWGMLKGYKS